MMEQNAKKLSNVRYDALVGSVHIHINDGNQFISADRASHDIQFLFRHAENLR